MDSKSAQTIVNMAYAPRILTIITLIVCARYILLDKKTEADYKGTIFFLIVSFSIGIVQSGYMTVESSIQIALGLVVILGFGREILNGVKMLVIQLSYQYINAISKCII
jgi:hypothetical protein